MGVAQQLAMGLVLDRQGFRINGLLARYPFEPSQNATVVVLIALHRETALLISVDPRQSDEMLLGLGEGHQRAYPKGDNADTNSGSHTPVNVLPITDLRHR